MWKPVSPPTHYTLSRSTQKAMGSESGEQLSLLAQNGGVEAVRHWGGSELGLGRPVALLLAAAGRIGKWHCEWYTPTEAGSVTCSSNSDSLEARCLDVEKVDGGTKATRRTVTLRWWDQGYQCNSDSQMVRPRPPGEQWLPDPHMLCSVLFNRWWEALGEALNQKKMSLDGHSFIDVGY